MAATVKYNQEYHDDWAWSLAIRGATDKEIAEAFKISARTVIRWKKTYPSFASAIENGNSGASARVEKALFKRATGYDVETTEKTVDVDKDGNTKPVRIKTVKQHIPADVGAMCFWLKNRAPDEWADRPRGTMEVEDTDDTDTEIYG